MRTIVIWLVSVLCGLAGASSAQQKLPPAPQLCFTENKGQVIDQAGFTRPDILYYGSSGSLMFHLKANGLSYQLSRVNSWVKNPLKGLNGLPRQRRAPDTVPSKLTVHRIDLRFIAPQEAIRVQPGGELPGVSNYYMQHCPNGITDVKNFTGVKLKSLYQKIDLCYYGKNGSLKYDFIVHPGGDFRDIQFVVTGATRISVNKKGALQITTPLGTIVEDAPYVTQKGRHLAAWWKVRSDTVAFEIQGANEHETLLIDPAVRTWGTYYGGSGSEYIYEIRSDGNSDVYVVGGTSSIGQNIIATSGAHQVSFGGGWQDAFIAKFNSAGSRIWATYYGGFDADVAVGCSTDKGGNVFICGGTTTFSGSVLVTSGCQQATYGGGFQDAFVSKFNSSGARLWSTYCGASGDDFAIGCASDTAGNVIISGYTDSPTSTLIASSGAHQVNADSAGSAFVAKYDPNGVRLWGSFYGGNSYDFGYRCATDGNCNIYMAGSSASTNSAAISTPGAHQPLLNGFFDAFLVKFNPAGVRSWATYYGAPTMNFGWTCATDAAGNVFLAGSSAAGTGSFSGWPVATAGSHQQINAGDDDGFLVKFSSNGLRQWGTYYGTAENDDILGCSVDLPGNVYICGSTSSQTSAALASSGAHQTTPGGGFTDAFLAKFNGSGTRQWSTYYGGTGDEGWASCVPGASASLVYLAGTTSSYNNVIATVNSHQPVSGGYDDGFIVQFSDCLPSNTTPWNSSNVCPGYSATLTVASASAVTWYTTPTGGQSVASGSVFVTPPLANGSYTYYAEQPGCLVGPGRIAIEVLAASPSVTVSGGSICMGQSFTLNPSGASTYTVSGGASVVSPTVTSTYSITGTNTVGGCSSSSAALCQIIVHSNPTVQANASSTAICSGSFVTLYGSGAATYTWVGGIWDNSPIWPSATAIYTVIGRDMYGCTDTDDITVVVHAPPLIWVIPSPAIICRGSAAVITAFGANTYTWYGLQQMPVTGQSVNVTAQQQQQQLSFYVEGTNNLGCIGYTYVSIPTAEQPTINAQATKSLICAGETATLKANGASTYTWSTFQQGFQAMVSPSSTQMYFVIGTGVNGCTNIAICTQSVSACLGLDGSETAPAVRAYPNPFKDVFTIDAPQRITSIKLFDTQSRLVFHHASSDSPATLALPGLPPGLYLVEVETQGSVARIRLLKE